MSELYFDPVGSDEAVKSSDTAQGKCASCGGSLVYSPEKQMLSCLYCGSDFPLELAPADVQENDFAALSAHPELWEQEETLIAEVACGQCGAHTTFPENTTSFSCAFCGTPIVLKASVTRRTWKPEYILPFKIGKTQCDKLLRKWASSLWFAPSGFAKKLLSDKQMKGIYLPYWTYDAETLTNYAGERGVSHVVTQRLNGRTVSQVVTDWHPVSGTVQYSFDDVLVPASNSLPRDIAAKMTNWDRQNYVTYNADFVQGFLMELYRDNFIDSFPAAKKQMETFIRTLVSSDIGGSQQRISRLDTHFSEIKFKHVLLPVWLSAYRYNNHAYVFAINGRTGQVTGQRPWSAWKIATLVIAIATLLALILFAGSG
ncbi:MAG: hypothetical protein LBR67_03635 [Dysgonamonadaceae bacterium]|jgi:uncharacterized CHY-type Zn-finger protein|nr:hypothetical protein [Dysgonamonadaceae bacterium]